MLTAIVLILFGLTAAIDWLPAIKKRPIKESVIYGLLMITALVILFLDSVGVEIMGPSTAINNAVKAIIPIE